MSIAAPKSSPPRVPAQDAQEKSFNASLDIVKLFTTLSSGALAFAIGLTAQSTNNYPGGFRTAILCCWAIFFVAILTGVWAQMNAPHLINIQNADPNAGDLRWPAIASVSLFVFGVGLLAFVLLETARFGAPGTALAVSGPPAALTRALEAAGVTKPQKIAALELVKGADPVRADESVWHVQLEIAGPRDKTSTLDVYVDPVTGCAHVVQQTSHTRGAPCRGF